MNDKVAKWLMRVQCTWYSGVADLIPDDEMETSFEIPSLSTLGRKRYCTLLKMWAQQAVFFFFFL